MRIIVFSEEQQFTQRLKQVLRDLPYKVDILVMPRGGYRQRFLVRQGQKLQSISIENIYYFYSEDRFIFFRTRENQKFLVDYRIEELEKMLDPAVFFRVNRSFLISIHAIDQVYPYYGNRLKLQAVFSTPKEIIVSRDRVPDFRAWLGE
ncbi:MAG TPA: LytTR family DNA-binding domain-containing protein [Puia sp.]|jgi:DNA-binding LytR/AlgR family response regulator|nr:LytTR family DNA-binding domain-containing protein [Puia sp.]HVW62244.1 LytTR family DNA-binding domain-containing protein [Puia sp.]